MKYTIIGAGGTGAVLGYYLGKNGRDVTLVARGEHLKTMQNQGLTITHLWNQTSETIPVKACSMENYNEHPDVIFVCVKGYSITDTIPFICRIAKPETIIIPILNIYGTGAQMQERLPENIVLDGCIYVSAFIQKPGVIAQHSDVLHVVYGLRDLSQGERILMDAHSHSVHLSEYLETIDQDLAACQIKSTLSQNIRKDCMKKFLYISPVGAASLYCNATAGDFTADGFPREVLTKLMQEMVQLANAMNISLNERHISYNLSILSGLPADATTSMQRDVLADKESEIDGLIFGVVRMARKYGLHLPMYETIAEKFKNLQVK